ncbi:MAG: hypothetical protein K6A97_02165 [Lachnospiraceae bacterium]|nr:hypothetical protein [Lachnospiraceae bacterium]
MKQIIKKSILLMSAIILLLSSIKLNAWADVTYVESNPEEFINEWERTVHFYSSNGAERAKMVYGFDKFMINEDYTWTWSNYPKHKAGVNNGNGEYWTITTLTTRWARKEVSHNGSTVYYSLWSDDNEWYSRSTPEVSDMK